MASPALAQDKAASWARWVERAERIEAAMDSGEEHFRSNIKTACNGVTGSVVGMRISVPYWAQGLIQVCTVLKEEWMYKDGKAQCKDVRRVIGIIGKATPVPEAPRAEPIAKHIAAMLQMAYDGNCQKR
jgi:hypothetical protein